MVRNLSIADTASAQHPDRETTRSGLSVAYSQLESQAEVTAAHGTVDPIGEQKDRGAKGEDGRRIQYFVQHVPVKGAVLNSSHLMQLDTHPTTTASSKLQSIWTIGTECKVDDAEGQSGMDPVSSATSFAERNGVKRDLHTLLVAIYSELCRVQGR